MNQEIYENLRMGLETAYIDSGISSNLTFKPQFVSNNHQEGKKVISSIEDELLSCDKFQISVAFITMSGITPLLQTLKELEEKNIPGEILTTNYLSFSEPRALKKLPMKVFIQRDIFSKIEKYIESLLAVPILQVRHSQATKSGIQKSYLQNRER